MTADTSQTHFPDGDRLSVVTAMLAVALLSGYFIHLPGEEEILLQFSWLVLPIHITVANTLAVLIAALTVAGTDWVLSDHPSLGKRSTAPSWLLPALTAWVLEVLLQHLPLGAMWWVTLFGGLAIWLAVLVAEYIVVDGEDARYPLAAAVLNGLGFLLFFLLVVAVRSSGLRLFFTAPMLGLAAGIVALRTLNLQLHGLWRPVETVFVMAIVTQFAAALHYLPIPPVAFGLILTAITYASTVFLGRLLEDLPPAQALWEPLAALGLLLLLLPWAW